MYQSDPLLDRTILAAFASAHEAGRFDVAEHLLCALECLRGEADETSAAEEAYRIICRGCDRGSRGRLREGAESYAKALANDILR